MGWDAGSNGCHWGCNMGWGCSAVCGLRSVVTDGLSSLGCVPSAVHSMGLLNEMQ